MQRAGRNGLLALALGCAAASAAAEPRAGGQGTRMPGATQDPGFTEYFGAGDMSDWQVAHYDFGHPAFDTDWRRTQVRIAQGLTLSLQRQDGGNNGFLGGAIRRETPTGYGHYEAVLRAAKGAGVVTGFFTYTGPAYGTRHDEIDIEILGQDTTRLHAAWFVDGRLQSRSIPLGFDASLGFNHYAFSWMPGRIVWKVNGQTVLDVVAAADTSIPAIPGRVFANLWAADLSISSWAGTTLPETRASARFRCIAHRPLQPGSAAFVPQCPVRAPLS